jgi:RNA polymerase sigma factor (sigma-70 family)
MADNDNRRATAENLESQIVELRPTIAKIVSLALQIFKQSAKKSEIEDICQQLILLLIEDDYRRLRSFEERASLSTWLRQVIFHQVSHNLKQSKESEELTEAAANSHFFLPTQEADIWDFEKDVLLLEAVISLPLADQRLFSLFCEDDLSMEEIAAVRGISVQAAYKQKQRLIQKIQKRVAEIVEKKSGKK